MKAAKPRSLNPRICRGCGLVFQPTTSLQRYGLPECKLLPKTLKIGGRTYGAFPSIAMPGLSTAHPKPKKERP